MFTREASNNVEAIFYDGSNLSETLKWLKDQGKQAMHAGRGNISFEIFGRMNTFTGKNYWLVHDLGRVFPMPDREFQETYNPGGLSEDPDQGTIYDELKHNN